MNIISGLANAAVLQRNKQNVSETHICGKTEQAGDVVVRVSKNGTAIRGFARHKLGRVNGGTFELDLTGIPIGGPYSIELELRDGRRQLGCAVYNEVMVGDVWLCAGQSNMQGCGRRENALPPMAEVRAFNMDDEWRVAEDPIHNMWACVDQVHIDLCGGERPAVNLHAGVGPAVAFGQAMFQETGVPQGLIASAHGGTSMSQWAPQLKRKRGRSLYGASLRRVQQVGGQIAGMIWYQGESDTSPEAAPLYRKRMNALLKAFRRDCAHAKLPVAIVQLSRFTACANESEWNLVQDQQRQLADADAQTALVPAVDLTLDDGIHVGGSDVNRLGRRLAQAMCSLTRKATPPIALKKVVSVPDSVTGLMTIEASFEHVAGELHAGTRPTGFALRRGDELLRDVFDIQLRGDTAIIRTGLGPEGLANCTLHYGYGSNPVCNIVDQEDRALPVFGPVMLDSQRALTPFLRTPQISKPLPDAGDLSAVGYPTDCQPRSWWAFEAKTSFCNIHPDLRTRPDEDLLIYFHARIDVPEAMKLRVLLGYDGPVKLWVDGKELLHEPNGTNPAAIDKAHADFKATPGEHELMVALGSNHGKAWGIYLRLERLGLRKATIAKGPDAYAMPRFLPASERFEVQRFANNPIIYPELHESISKNINGPSLMRVPSWLPNALGRYYLYFADHEGTYIRLAYADKLEGPWQVYVPGTLQLEETQFEWHIASPDVHIDDDNEQIVMYYHGCRAPSGQVTCAALSKDGIHFTDIGEHYSSSYFRRFEWDGYYYAFVMPGTFHRSRDPLHGYEEGPTLFNEHLRHAALKLDGNVLTIIYSNRQDCPERLLYSTVELTGDWHEWTASEPRILLASEYDWEGRHEPWVPSQGGFVHGPARQLRDPEIFQQNGRTFLLYAVAGENGIAIAELIDHRE